MKIKGTHSIPLSREAVWAALLDPEVIRQALPGCDELTETGPHAYQAQINVRVGPVTGTFESRFVIEDLTPPSSYQLKIHGQGGAGFLDANGEIRLEEDGESTLLYYDMDASVGGRVASVGQRLLESTARVMARQGLKRLDSQLQKLAEQGVSVPPGVAHEDVSMEADEESEAGSSGAMHGVDESEPAQSAAAAPGSKQPVGQPGAAPTGNEAGAEEEAARPADRGVSDEPDLAFARKEVSPELPSGKFTPGRIVVGLLALAVLGFALMRACSI